MKLYLTRDEANIIISNLRTTNQDMRSSLKKPPTENMTPSIIEVCEEAIDAKEKIILYLEEKVQDDE